MASEVQAIRDGNEEVREKLQQEASPTFPWILERNSRDLVEVDQALDSRVPDTGMFVQVLVHDVRDRYQYLLEALDEEMKRRQEEMARGQEESAGEEEAGQQQQGANPLVPPVAELILVKRLEEDVLLEVRAFRAEDEMFRDEASRQARGRLLERLGHRHGALTGLFDDLLETQSGAALEEPDEGGPEPGPDEEHGEER